MYNSNVIVKALSSILETSKIYVSTWTWRERFDIIGGIKSWKYICKCYTFISEIRKGKWYRKSLLYRTINVFPGNVLYLYFHSLSCLLFSQQWITKALNFQSRKRLYNHKCPFVRLSVISQNPSTAWNHHTASFIFHHSSFILHHSSFILHHSSFILPSYRDF